MGFDKLFTQNVILETAMQATNYKNNALIQNLANVDTPDYQRVTVNFESSLSDAIDKTKSSGVNSHMSGVMSGLSFTPKTDQTTIDGNTIDVETEMIELYKNATKYDVMVASVKTNSNINSAIYNSLK